MSWTSPLTVAMTMRPFVRDAPGSRSASMNGTRWATAFFITRALLTTCGRNILPGAEEVADDVHPVHQRALDDLDGASRGLAGGLGVLDDPGIEPSTSAWVSRSLTGSSRHARASPPGPTAFARSPA